MPVRGHIGDPLASTGPFLGDGYKSSQYRPKYRLRLMKPLLVEVDDDLARRLDQVAPARSRRRSEFIRRAIMAAIWEIEEQATAEAYGRQPDSPDAVFDPTVWDSYVGEDGP